MKAKAYLTIDDSPSADTDALVDFLTAEEVPAILFCRGDRLEADAAPVIRAIGKGFVIGNHAFSHQRLNHIGFDAMTAEIEKTDALIDAAYRAAGVGRPGQYFRFPHMDRGTAGWVVDYDAAPPAYRDTLVRLFADGLNVSLDPPTDEQKHLKQRMQDWLRGAGFTALPFEGVTHPWYTQTEMKDAVDAMFTFSTADWMLTARHLGKWPYKTMGDLIAKIDGDQGLHVADSAQIVLLHDQDALLPVVRPLVLHMKKTLEFAVL